MIKELELLIQQIIFTLKTETASVIFLLGMIILPIILTIVIIKAIKRRKKRNHNSSKLDTPNLHPNNNYPISVFRDDREKEKEDFDSLRKNLDEMTKSFEEREEERRQNQIKRDLELIDEFEEYIKDHFKKERMEEIDFYYESNINSYKRDLERMERFSSNYEVSSRARAVLKKYHDTFYPY